MNSFSLVPPFVGSGGAAAPWIGMGLDFTANATNVLIGVSK
ncbi:hypothetical protein [Sulfurimonas sp.]